MQEQMIGKMMKHNKMIPKGRKTNKQSHVDVDVTITNKNKSTKASTKVVRDSSVV